jgi:hypothetical protein
MRIPELKKYDLYSKAHHPTKCNLGVPMSRPIVGGSCA